MEKFESIFKNRKMVNKLSSNEQYQFKGWLRDKHSGGEYSSLDIFEMTLFICFE